MHRRRHDRCQTRSDSQVCARQRGSTTSEQVLLLSVIMVAVVAVGQGFVSIFESGVEDMSRDVVKLLSNKGKPDPLPPPPFEYSGGGDGGGGGGGGGGDGGGGDGGGGGGGDDGGDPPPSSEGTPAAATPEESTCPYVYDEASDRWRDPETGQYVSGEDAANAGC